MDRLQSLFRLGIGGRSSSLSSSSWSSRTDIGSSHMQGVNISIRCLARKVASDPETASRETVASHYLPSFGVVQVGGFS